MRLFTVDRTARHVNGFSLADTPKVNVSVAISQHSPRLRCIGVFSLLRSMSFRPFVWSSEEKASITAALFDAILCRLRFDLASDT